MNVNRVIVGLIGVTLVLQLAILYKQFTRSTGKAVGLEGAVTEADDGITIDVAGLAKKGSADARIILAEFSDYECPFCERHASTVAIDLDKAYIAAGHVARAFANNPLPIHPNARLLAAAAICGGEQGDYWSMHEALFTNKPRTKQELVMLAHKLSLDESEFETCIETAAVQERIDREAGIAKSLQLSGTPSFAIGTVDGKGYVAVQKFIRGAVPLKVFTDAIEEVSAKVKDEVSAKVKDKEALPE